MSTRSTQLTLEETDETIADELTDANGRTRDEFDDPVIVKTRNVSGVRVHDTHPVRPVPNCRHATREGVRWRFVERCAVEGVDRCTYCSGAYDPASAAADDKDCPFCGETVRANRLPNHLQNDCSR